MVQGPGIGEWEQKGMKLRASKRVGSGNKALWGIPGGEAFRLETQKLQPWWDWGSGGQEGLLGTSGHRTHWGFGKAALTGPAHLGILRRSPEVSGDHVGLSHRACAARERAASLLGSLTCSDGSGLPRPWTAWRGVRKGVYLLLGPRPTWMAPRAEMHMT